MKKLIVSALLIATGFVAFSASATIKQPTITDCTFSTICDNRGHCVNCTTCCFANNCNTNCY